MTVSGELAGCIRRLGAGKVSQHSPDFHTLEPGGGGGGSGGILAGVFGGSCFPPHKGHLSLRTELGGQRRCRESGAGLGWVGVIFFSLPPSPVSGWRRYVAGWRVK